MNGARSLSKLRTANQLQWELVCRLSYLGIFHIPPTALLFWFLTQSRRSKIPEFELGEGHGHGRLDIRSA